MLRCLPLSMQRILAGFVSHVLPPGLLAGSLLACAVAVAAPTDDLVFQEIAPPPPPPAAIDLNALHHNLWDRVRLGFAMPDLNDDLVEMYQTRYLNRPEGLRRMIERARPYLHHIVEELELRGMPTELALLPMVESAFNPMAQSPAQASGLWQFIPATGRRFKLEQDWWRDERRDVVASTGAALDYLQAIYDMHGDWHLALASYNWGEGAVRRARERNEARGLATDYPSLKLPDETRHYIPKLQALKNILGDPFTLSRLGLPDIPNRPYLSMLMPERPMDIKTAARLANMSVDEFRHLNPAHNRPIIHPDLPVVLPADRIDTFHHNLENHHAPLTQWQVYTLRQTERASDLARRLGVTLSELNSANGLNGNVLLASGSRLLVPGSDNPESLDALLGVSHSPVIIQPEPKRKGKATGKVRGKPGASPAPRNAGAKQAAPARKAAARSDTKPRAKPAAKPAAKTPPKGAAKPAKPPVRKP